MHNGGMNRLVFSRPCLAMGFDLAEEDGGWERILQG